MFCDSVNMMSNDIILISCSPWSLSSNVVKMRASVVEDVSHPYYIIYNIDFVGKGSASTSFCYSECARCYNIHTYIFFSVSFSNNNEETPGSLVPFTINFYKIWRLITCD